MIFKHLISTGLALVLIYTIGFGQRIENSPYSRFGLGDKVDKNNIAIRAMGGLSTSFVDPYHFNAANPASLPYLYASSFDLGIGMKRATLTDPSSSTTALSGNIDYLTLAFPLSNPINEAYEGLVKDHKWALAMSLNRLYQVSYNIQSIDSIAEIGNVERNYTGQGGTNQFALNGGYKYKNFSAGISLGYIFGNTEYKRNTNFYSILFPFNNNLSNKFFLKGFSLNTGVMYALTINKGAIAKNKATLPKRLVLGLTYNNGSNLSTSSTVQNFSIQQLATGFSIVDTIQLDRNLSGKAKLPSEITLGAFYQTEEKFGLGVELSRQPWSNYYNEANYEKINSLNDVFSVSIGGFLRPDYKSFTSYFKRVTYRFGSYYRQDPRIVNDQRVNNYGVTTGVTLPFVYQRKISHVNLTLDIGKSGAGTLISETYFKLGGGFNFNDDEWFLKRKYK